MNRIWIFIGLGWSILGGIVIYSGNASEWFINSFFISVFSGIGYGFFVGIGLLISYLRDLLFVKKSKKLLKIIPNAEIKQAYIQQLYKKGINWDLDTKKPINQKSIPKTKVIGYIVLPKRRSISLKFLDIFYFIGVSKTIRNIKDYTINSGYKSIEWNVYVQTVTYKSKKPFIKSSLVQEGLSKTKDGGYERRSIVDKKLEKKRDYQKFLKDFNQKTHPN
jgi:hypothetical protein